MSPGSRPSVLLSSVDDMAVTIRPETMQSTGLGLLLSLRTTVGDTFPGGGSDGPDLEVAALLSLDDAAQFAIQLVEQILDARLGIGGDR